MESIEDRIYLATLFLVVCVSVFTLSRQREGPRLFLYFLVMTFGVELITALLETSKPKHIIYTVYGVLSIVAYGHVYRKLLFDRRIRGVHLWSAVAAILSVFWVFPFGLVGESFPVAMYLVISLFGIVSSLLFFIDCIAQPTLESLTSRFGFWISVGLLLMSTNLIFRIGAQHYFYNKNKAFLDNLQLLQTIVNIIAYVIYLKGVTCLLPKKKSS